MGKQERPYAKEKQNHGEPTHTLPKPEVPFEKFDPNLLQEYGFRSPVIRTDEGLFVVVRQKTLLLTKKEIEEEAYKKLRLGRKPEYDAFSLRIIRTCDCPNSDGLYPVLVEFPKEVNARDALAPLLDPDNQEVPLQANNFVLCGRDPISPPPPPVYNHVGPRKALETDFQIPDAEDLDQPQYTSSPHANKGGVIALVDTGVTYDMNNRTSKDPTAPGIYKYTDQDGQERTFKLFKGLAACDQPADGIGYCGVTTYLTFREQYPQQGEGGLLEPLRQYDPSDIRRSAFDDNRLKPAPGDNSQPNEIFGRHGTVITAILNQQAPDAAVLPVKAFDQGGFATLFDVLCSLNYVMAQKQAGVPIQLLNASWSARLDEKGIGLLRDKFKELQAAGILVITAAGNEPIDLATIPHYPACFSIELDNIITVTTVRRDPRFFWPVSLFARIVVFLLQVFYTLLGLDSRRLADLFLYRYATNLAFSNPFVTVGVYGGNLAEATFRYPFDSPALLNATSFATAYVTAGIARYLNEQNITLTAGNMANERASLLNRLTVPRPELADKIQEGRLLFV